MRVNEEIRASQVRVINEKGEQVGVVSLSEALNMADRVGLDLVEIVATSTPPVCKIISFSKFRYDQTKREKESRKSQHHVKVKEIKFKPNINPHDLGVKRRHAQELLEEGHKVKVSCFFRGREMAHTDIGEKLMQQFLQELADVGAAESEAKMFGSTLQVVLAPVGKKK